MCAVQQAITAQGGRAQGPRTVPLRPIHCLSEATGAHFLSRRALAQHLASFSMARQRPGMPPSARH
jgi:hypothetical protein